MSYTVSIGRNPNLSIPEFENRSRDRVPRPPHEIKLKFGSNWWTGLAPEKCPGFNRDRHCLEALPLLNLDLCTKQDILDYFNNSWTLTELLFLSLREESTYVRPPYHELRHPLIFYYGHPAVLYYNKLRLAGLAKDPLDLYLEKVLETGVDEMSWDDMSKNEMQWPSIEDVHSYRQKVYAAVISVIQNLPERPHLNLKWGSPFWALSMGFEHEKIHLETTSVLMRELPLSLVEQPEFWPPLHESALQRTPSRPQPGVDYQAFQWKQSNGATVEYGKSKEAPSYGWDNEYGQRKTQIKDFQVSDQLISNGEFYEFVASLAYSDDHYWSEEGKAWRKFRNTKRPTFWVAFGPEGLHDYKLRTLFDLIDMPWSWPVEVNYHEAQAFARWKTQRDKSNLHYRLLTEPEHVQLRQGLVEDPVLQKKLGLKLEPRVYNHNLIYSSPHPVQIGAPNPAGIRDLFGNIWQWAEDQFNPLDGFQVHPLYDDFSTPCFDGKHQMILGGSFMSCGHEASIYARFHFRPHFFQHAGFRLAATLDGSLDNASTKILRTQTYKHPKRENCLEQMQSPHWLKDLQQPLEFTASEREKLWEITVKSVLDFEKNRNQLAPMGTALDPATQKLRDHFRVPYQGTTDFPTRTESYQNLLKLITQELVPLGQQPGHPGYFAYVSGAGNEISPMAQALADVMNPFTGHTSLAPGFVRIEKEALVWLISMVKFPNTASGFFTTGGSQAMIAALSMARKEKFKNPDLSKARFYASTQAHHCVGKALSFLGFPQECLNLIPVDSAFQMQVSELEKQILKDLKSDLTPVAVIGTAGTTNLGAIDPLNSIADTCEKHQIWFHVDGAYGGFFLLTQSGQEKLAGAERAHSILMDPHKSLSLPYGTGCLLVRDAQYLRYQYAGQSHYMPPASKDQFQRLIEDDTDFADITPELSREFRGLRFWLPIKTLGIQPFQLNLEEKLQLAKGLAQELRNISGLQVVTEPSLSIVGFHAESNEQTQSLLDGINSSQRFFLTATRLEGRMIIRVCLLGYRSHQRQMLELVDLIRKLRQIKGSPS